MSRIGQGLARSERETIIRIAQDENEWTIYTTIPAHAKKLDRIAILTKDLGYAREYRLTKACVTLRKKRIVSQKQMDSLARARQRTQR